MVAIQDGNPRAPRMAASFPVRFLRFIGRLARGDVKKTWDNCVYRVSEYYYERRFGVRTEGGQTLPELGITNGECGHYSPVPYRFLQKVFASLEVREGQDVFLDYGCGKGRALIMAARLPFREVIGVDVSPRMCVAAQENIGRAATRLRCTKVRIYPGDAADFAMPDEVSVIYFYNPFFGSILAAVLDRIEKSLRRRSRQITLIYFNDYEFARQVRDRGWVRKLREYPFRGYHSCGVYQCEL